MKEGEWQVKMTTTTQGAPFKAPIQTHTMIYCATKEDLALHDKNKKDCVIKNQRISGNTFYWTALCEDESSKTEGNGRITYNGSTYEGEIISTVNDKEQGMNISILTTLEGQYRGPCPKATNTEAEKRKGQFNK